MFFSKIELRRDSNTVIKVARSLTRDGYRLHQALWRLFKGEQQQRDFLYRRLESASWPCFYIVSARPPVDDEGLWNIQVKDYTPQLTAHQHLAFSLCANPVVTKSGPNGKPVRHDVVMDTKQQRRLADEGVMNQASLIQEAGQDWLAKRTNDNGFRLETVRVEGYRQHRFRKARNKDPIRFSSLDFEGVLTVTEPEQFEHVLFHGIGPAKGFGCGLLLIRRIP